MKIATLEDFNEIKDMAMKFMSKTEYTKYADEEVISQLIYNILTGEQNEMIILLEPGMGMLAGITTPFMFGNCLLASEIAWWVNEDQRKSGVGTQLVEAFEYWAKEKAGCKIITMSVLGHESGQFYAKHGYQLYEQAWMKEL